MQDKDYYAPDIMNYEVDEEPEVLHADDNHDEQEVIQDTTLDTVMEDFNQIIHDMKIGVKNILFQIPK